MSLASRHRLLPCVALVAVIAVVPAWSQDRRDDGRQPPPREREVAPTPAERSMQSPQMRRPRSNEGLSDSIRRVERTTRGQVLSVERMMSDGRDVNRIKVVDQQGRVRVYMDDPQAPSAPRTRRDDD